MDDDDDDGYHSNVNICRRIILDVLYKGTVIKKINRKKDIHYVMNVMCNRCSNKGS
jgi:hypothetical protein